MMKSLNPIILATLLILLGCFKSFAIQEYAEVTFDLGTLKIDTVSKGRETFSVIKAKAAYANTEVGTPELPVYYVQFIVPVLSKNFRAEITPLGQEQFYSLVYRPLPVQAKECTDSVGNVVFNAPLMASYNAQPQYNVVKKHDNFINRCEHIVTLEVKPIKYDNTDISITTCNRFGVTLFYDKCTAAELKETPIYAPEGTVDFKLKEFIVNPEKYTEYTQHRPPTDNSRKYIIVAPQNLVESVSDLALWKKEKGYDVIIKTIEEILSSPSYTIGSTKVFNSGNEQIVDSAASLRAYLKEQYEKAGSYYCLLVGDSRTTMPIRRVMTTVIPPDQSPNHPYTYNPNGDNYTPTDNYFSDFTTKWILAKEGNQRVYSLNSGNIQYSPDISIGRLLCSTQEEVKNYLPKLIRYESNPGNGDNAYLQKFIYIEQGPTNKVGFLGNSETVRQSFAPFTSDKTIVIADSCAYVNNYHDIVPHKGKDIISLLSRSGFSSWHGHGSPTNVGCCGSQYFISANSNYSDEQLWGRICLEWDSLNGLNNMRNENYPSIVYSPSCTNAPFDLYTEISYTIPEGKHTKTYIDGHVYDIPYNLASAFTVAGNYGGPAFLGNTRVGKPTESAYLEAEFGRSILKLHGIGIAEALSKSTYRHFHVSFSHHLIGDPEFNMWLEIPQKFSDIELSDTGLNIYSSHLLGSKITIYEGTGSPKTFNCNTTSFQIPAQTVMTDYCISIWKTGYLPVIKMFAPAGTITETAKKYLVNEAFIGSDNSSNSQIAFSVGNNGLLDVKAMDAIVIKPGFSVNSGATVILECDGNITVGACVVKSGGTLILKGDNIHLSAGFKVEKGAKFEIKNI